MQDSDATGITRVSKKVSHALVTPLGITLSIPLLVILIALFIGWNGRTTLKRSMQSMAEARFADHVNMVRHQSQTLLNQAPRLLNQFDLFLQRNPKLEVDHELIRTMKVLVRNSPGVSWVSFGNERGSYWGVYQRTDGEMRYVTCQQDREPRGGWQEFNIDGDELVEVLNDPRRGYDPRARAWYSDTKRTGKRRWTDPYIFVNQNVPGITCAEPVFSSDGNFRGVMTVDFSLYHLSQSVNEICEDEGYQLFLFTDKLEMLTHPDLSFEEPSQGRSQMITMADVRDQRLLQFMEQLKPGSLLAQETLNVQFRLQDQNYMGMMKPLQLNADVRWFIGSLTSFDQVIAPATAHWNLALWMTVLGLVGGIMIALWFARHVVRSRRMIQDAQDQVEATQSEMRELGSYRLLRKIGTGGMGEVWQAEHKMLARRAAIKLIKKQALQFNDHDDIMRTIQRFSLEAKVTARLCSPHTVQLYDYGVSSDNTFYYVMEMLDGMDLDTLVQQHGKQPLARVLWIMRGVASSLAEAHALGMVHRDVKPANIYICRMGIDVDIPKVLDFGLVLDVPSQDKERLTVDGMVSGTPAYMAPEQATGSAVDGRADLYALACVAWFLLVGHDVFERDSAQKVLMAQVYDQPKPLNEVLDQAIPESVVALLHRCLAKEPEQRPQDMLELIVEIDKLVEDEGLYWSVTDRQQWWQHYCPDQNCGDEDPSSSFGHIVPDFVRTETSAASKVV